MCGGLGKVQKSAKPVIEKNDQQSKGSQLDEKHTQGVR